MSLMMRVAAAVLARGKRRSPEPESAEEFLAAIDPQRAAAELPKALAARTEPLTIGGIAVDRIAPAGDDGKPARGASGTGKTAASGPPASDSSSVPGEGRSGDGSSASGGTHVLYFHGGAYVNPAIGAHGQILAALQKASGATIWVPRYPLAPEHTVDDVLPILDELYAAVRQAAADDGGRWVLAGDSAGGGLALVHALRLGAEGPDALVLFAPWVDISTSNPDALELEKRDPMLSVSRLQAAAGAWAGERGVKHPEVSPLFAPLVALRNLPPTTLFVGGRDLLAPDVRLMAERLRRAGVETELVDRPDAFHVYVGATFTPEAKADLAHAGRVIAGRLPAHAGRAIAGRLPAHSSRVFAGPQAARMRPAARSDCRAIAG